MLTTNFDFIVIYMFSYLKKYSIMTSLAIKKHCTAIRIYIYIYVRIDLNTCNIKSIKLTAFLINQFLWATS